MTNLFSNDQAAAYGAPNNQAIPLVLGGASGNSPSMLVSDFNGSLAVVHQVSYDFDNNAYVVVFGERTSNIALNGMAVPFGCDAAAKKLSIKALITTYDKHKLKPDNPKSISISLGGIVLKGYFTSLTLRLLKTDTAAFSFSIGFLGEKT